MAPNLAIAELNKLSEKSIILDPMSGSGTVLRQASQLGHSAYGFDMDPLAVLMARVWTTPVESKSVLRLSEALLNRVKELRVADVKLPWIDNDPETREFCKFWFATRQRNQLRKIVFALNELQLKKKRSEAAISVLKVALSRIIITKDQGASLARDVSHSRPHKVAEESDYDVISALERSITTVVRLMESSPLHGKVEIREGDARSLTSMKDRSVDLVLTSPPYLNAIDYMRGHRLALVWLGHKLADLRGIRSSSIGTERGPDSEETSSLFEDIQEAMVDADDLSNRHLAMVVRYSEDLYRMMSEIKRVLKPKGRAVLVVGDSCLKGTFIKNSAGVVAAGRMVGLKLTKKTHRKLPDNKRYLPMPAKSSAPLGGRMRTENIITFAA
jgi:DNA modification methylase